MLNRIVGESFACIPLTWFSRTILVLTTMRILVMHGPCEWDIYNVGVPHANDITLTTSYDVALHVIYLERLVNKTLYYLNHLFIYYSIIFIMMQSPRLHESKCCIWYP